MSNITEANARLIAAAPELLEALKALLIQHEGACRRAIYVETEQARTAIAKAEGRQ